MTHSVATMQTPLTSSTVKSHQTQPSLRCSKHSPHVAKSGQVFRSVGMLQDDPVHPSSQEQLHVSVQQPLPLQLLRLLQSQANSELQTALQAPCWHSIPSGHTCPQLPQWLTSFCTLKPLSTTPSQSLS